MSSEPRWLLDTCVLSELARQAPAPQVMAWLRGFGLHCRISTVTLGEFSYGVESLPPSARRNRLQAWVGELQHLFADRIVQTDLPTWLLFGRLKAAVRALGRPQDDLDLLIAATAISNGLALATRNERHFQDTGVRLTNPWDYKSA